MSYKDVCGHWAALSNINFCCLANVWVSSCWDWVSFIFRAWKESSRACLAVQSQKGGFNEAWFRYTFVNFWCCKQHHQSSRGVVIQILTQFLLTVSLARQTDCFCILIFNLSIKSIFWQVSQKFVLKSTILFNLLSSEVTFWKWKRCWTESPLNRRGVSQTWPSNAQYHFWVFNFFRKNFLFSAD